MLELGDGTELPTYQSPNLPFGRGADWSDPVCNLYSMLKSQEAMRRLFDGLNDRADNGRELVMARWGMPTPPQYLVGKRTDPGVTNIRRLTSSHWRPWLGTDHRCLIPFTSFAENELQPDGTRPPVWFSFDETRPLAFFAGQATAELFGLLTTEPNAKVGAVHPKAMPAILTEAPEWETWLSAPWADAKVWGEKEYAPPS